ncbi:MAG: BamA/TamA family outer membrane protein [Rhodothermales bacterium]
MFYLVLVRLRVAALAAFGLLLVGLGQQALAQTAVDPEEASLVTRVRFTGDVRFDREELALRIRTRANRRFLGVPGLYWWLGLYRLGSERVGGRIGKAMVAVGEPPAYLDTTVVRDDVERLRNYYQQEGFRRAEIAARIDTVRTGRVHVDFHIEPGPPTYIRTMTLDGVDGLPLNVQRRLVEESLIEARAINSEAPLVYRANGARYSEPTLLEERSRILTFMLDQGYAAISRDSVRALIVPFRPDSFDVRLRIRPGERYRVGDVAIDVQGPEADAAPRADTIITVAPDAGVAGGEVAVQMRGESKLRTSFLMRILELEPGAWYRQSDLLATKRQLEATGLFGFTDILPQAQDTVRLVADGPPRLPYRIQLQTRPRHLLGGEAFMLQRNDVFTGADTELGGGVGLTYENTNLFGGGEAFRLRGSGSIAGDFSEGLFTSQQLELAASLRYPYLVPPFRWVDRVFQPYTTRTQFSLTFLSARRDAIGLIIRGRGTARLRLEMQHSSTIASFFDVLDLTLSNPDTLQGFQTKFLGEVLEVIEDPVQRAQIREEYTEPQVNSALRYTLRSARVHPLRRDQGYSYEVAAEVGGNLLRALDDFVFTPSTLEGTLPGLRFLGGASADDRLTYRQYTRFLADARRYRPLGPNSVWAWKAIVGLAQPIGQSEIVPFDRRFYSGGSTSVRGWRLRELGPGALSLADLAGAGGDAPTNILGGDIKLELSTELRVIVVRNFLKANWMPVIFADAGNVWFGPRNPGDSAGRFRFDRFYREVGVGSGVGLRLAWEFLIVRLDWAAQVYNPAGRSAADSGRNLHFGIGHAF